MTKMPEPNVDALEEQIRATTLLKRVRVAEFFKDYDSLRSGYVTKAQFVRCLDISFDIVLPPEEEAALLRKYQDKDEHTVNYKKFADVIERVFTPNDLKSDPATKTMEARKLLGTESSLRPVSPATIKKVEDIIEQIAQYYKYHGIRIRQCYEDFDLHNIGLVTESQFLRNFPEPPGLEKSEIHLLARRYGDPKRATLVNYLNFHNDVEKAKEKLEEVLFEGPPPSTYNIPREMTMDEELSKIFSRIQVAVHKYGIRTTEFFRDHDKLRSGIITENQFVCGLSLCVGREANLTRGEIQKVVDFYRNEEGRVRYNTFCDVMENAFNDPHFEKNPRLEVYRPPVGTLSRSLNPLTATENNRLERVLSDLRTEVMQRRLMMFPYFKDYDRSRAYTRNVTKDQFGRILHFLTLNVQPEDFKLLCRKFEEPISKDINYPAFVQAVDKEFIGFTMDSGEPTPVQRSTTPKKEVPIDTTGVNLEDIVKSIRHHALVNRVRVCEYFQDFDPLRERSIPKSRFRIGLSAMGQHNLTDAEFQVLIDYYEDPDRKGSILWQKFEKDIETVFTQVLPNLEKTPTSKVLPFEAFHIEKPGTMDWSQAMDKEKLTVDHVMDRMRQRVEQRRVLTKPCFQDFDLHNIGTVTQAQFRQCLTFLGLNTSEEEMEALELKYSNNMGFNYLTFLEDLQPAPKPELKYEQRLHELRQVNSKVVSLERNPLTNIDAVMDKIKRKVIKERIRVLEFIRDYDKLRSGKVLKTKFVRALDAAQLGLQPTEVEVLKQEFEYPGEPDYINYLRFNDEVESVFTLKNLEKLPQVTPVQFKPPVEVDLNKLSKEGEELLAATMDKLAIKVRNTQMQLYPLFEDYDKAHNCSVTQSQFRRVLSELELGWLVNEKELQVLYHKFEVNVGYQKMVNYVAFCDMIYKLANIELFIP